MSNSSDCKFVLPCSSLLKFARETITVQIDIAKRVRDLQNDVYAIYAPDFVTASTIRVGDFRIQVDSAGKRAVLCSGAQNAFSIDDYLYFAQDIAPDELNVVDGVVYLRTKHTSSTGYSRRHYHPFALPITATHSSQEAVIEDVVKYLTAAHLCEPDTDSD